MCCTSSVIFERIIISMEILQPWFFREEKHEMMRVVFVILFSSKAMRMML
jgi:hypothetical protein